jgi:hypothetical protein
VQFAESEQLAIIEKVAPIIESVTHGLARVVPVFQAKVRQADLSALLRFDNQSRTLGKRRMIRGTGGQVLLLTVARQNELCVVPEVWPAARLSDNLQDRKIALAVRASSSRAGGRARGEVKVPPTASASNAIVRR